MRFRIVLIGILIILLGSVIFVKNPTYAASPWDGLWETIRNLQSQISSKSSITYYQVVSNVSVVNPGNSGHAIANCNTGDTVVGGGYDINPSPNLGESMMTLYTNIPFGQGSWAVSGVNSGLNTNSQNLYAYAICSHYN